MILTPIWNKLSIHSKRYNIFLGDFHEPIWIIHDIGFLLFTLLQYLFVFENFILVIIILPILRIGCLFLLFKNTICNLRISQDRIDIGFQNQLFVRGPNKSFLRRCQLRLWKVLLHIFLLQNFLHICILRFI